MTQPTLETDYLVIGAGAVAMAFVDSLLSEDPAARVLMVDHQHRLGGHWNDAYPSFDCTSLRSGMAWRRASSATAPRTKTVSM